ncbi:peptidase M20 domain-containing protein 2 [Trichonephila clavipes]|nr:peptidase M20 domain-containing protein 2 [Trichonephila clavipes]
MQFVVVPSNQGRSYHRINAIITKGGVVPNVIPAESTLQIAVRSATKTELKDLTARITECVKSGAAATGCTASIDCDEKHCYESLVTNKFIAKVYDQYARKLGIYPTDFSGKDMPAGSTDMGNVSHAIPSIHPFYNINTEAQNHSKSFTEASGDTKAQEPTLKVAKALAMTALTLMRYPETMKEAKKQFNLDIAGGL